MWRVCVCWLNPVWGPAPPPTPSSVWCKHVGAEQLIEKQIHSISTSNVCPAGGSAASFASSSFPKSLLFKPRRSGWVTSLFFNPPRFADQNLFSLNALPAAAKFPKRRKVCLFKDVSRQQWCSQTFLAVSVYSFLTIVCFSSLQVPLDPSELSATTAVVGPLRGDTHSSVGPRSPSALSTRREAKCYIMLDCCLSMLCVRVCLSLDLKKKRKLDKYS